MRDSQRDESLPRRRGLEGELPCFLLLAALGLALRLFIDPDLGGHLLYGLDSLRAGAVARSDPYSYTAQGSPWVNHEWLFEWLLARVYVLAGPAGLGLVQLVFVGAGAALALRLALRSTRDVLAIGILWSFYLAILAPSLGIRPQLATYVLFPALLLVLESTRAGRTRMLLWIAPLFVVWANLHGGFIAGLGLLGLYAVGMLLHSVQASNSNDPADSGRLRNAVAVCAAVPVAAAATLLNPWGIGLWRWLRHSLGTGRLQIVEWQPLHADATGLAFGGLAIVAGLVLIRSRSGRVPCAHALVLLATLVESLLHARHALFFAVSALAFVPGRLRDLLRARRPAHEGEVDLSPRHKRVVRLAGAVVIVPLLAIHTGWPPGRTFLLPISPSDPVASYPTGAFAFIEEHGVEGNMAVWFDWAQMVMFRYAPGIRVAYDGRFRTVYPDGVERAYFDFIGGTLSGDWNHLLLKWPTAWVLLPAGGPATDRMRAEPGWWLVYQDDVSALFERAHDGESPPPTVRGVGRGPVLRFERVARSAG